MKRPLFVVGFSFAGAMYAAFFFEARQALLLSMAALLTGLLLYFISKKHMVIAVVLFSAAASFGVYARHDMVHLAPFRQIEGETVTVEGLIIEASANARRFDYTVRASFPYQGLPDAIVHIRDYGEIHFGEGDVIHFEAELTPASSVYYRNRNIAATGRARSDYYRVHDREYPFENLRFRIREYLRGNIYASLPKDTADIAGAMAMKLGDPIEASVYSHMNRSGISHLLSISGLHFSIISVLALRALRRTGLPRRFPELITLALGFCFVMITGFSASILRAFVVFLVALAGQLSYRRGDALNSLGFAMLVICVIWPHWTQTLSLWLSSLATMGILTAGAPLSTAISRYLHIEGRHRGLAEKLSAASGMSLAAYLFILPLLVLQSGWISFIALPANVLVTPFVTPALLGSLLCALVPPAFPLMPAIAWATDICIRILLSISEVLSGIPFATTSIDQTWKLVWLAGVILVCVLAFRYRQLPRIKSLAAMVCVFGFSLGTFMGSYTGRDTLELVTLSGCGSSLFIRQGHAVILESPNQFEARTLLRYMEYRDIKSVSLLVAANHNGRIDSGLMRLLEDYPVEVIAGPDDAFVLGQLAAAAKGVPVYSSGEAAIDALGALQIRVDNMSGEIITQLGGYHMAGGLQILNRGAGEAEGFPGIEILEDGQLSMPPDLSPAFTPVGEAIYGEIRVRFTVR